MRINDLFGVNEHLGLARVHVDRGRFSKQERSGNGVKACATVAGQMHCRASPPTCISSDEVRRMTNVIIICLLKLMDVPLCSYGGRYAAQKTHLPVNIC